MKTRETLWKMREEAAAILESLDNALLDLGDESMEESPLEKEGLLTFEATAARLRELNVTEAWLWEETKAKRIPAIRMTSEKRGHIYHWGSVVDALKNRAGGWDFPPNPAAEEHEDPTGLDMAGATDEPEEAKVDLPFEEACEEKSFRDEWYTHLKAELDDLGIKLKWALFREGGSLELTCEYGEQTVTVDIPSWKTSTVAESAAFVNRKVIQDFQPV